MAERAAVILDLYQIADGVFEPAAVAPNFPEELKVELADCVDLAGSVSTVEEKAALAAKFSDVFQKIYEGKQAYIKLMNAAASLEAIESENLPLVEYIEADEEAGLPAEWVETGDMVFTEEET